MGGEFPMITNIAAPGVRLLGEKDEGQGPSGAPVSATAERNLVDSVASDIPAGATDCVGAFRVSARRMEGGPNGGFFACSPGFRLRDG